GLTARPEYQPTGESLTVLHDLALGSQVEAALMHDPNVWVENLRVTARGGELTLSGQVLAEEDRDAAEAAARAVGGARIIRNEIAVQPPPLTGMYLGLDALRGSRYQAGRGGSVLGHRRARLGRGAARSQPRGRHDRPRLPHQRAARRGQ